MTTFNQTAKPINLSTVIAVVSLLISMPSLASDGTAPLKCTLVADASTGNILHRSGICNRRFSPFSSFKLPLALMGFDSGILESPTAPVWELKPEYHASQREQAFKQVDPASWERNSIVWFSQQLTTRLGKQKFSGYVKAFGYGNQDVSGHAGQDNGLTHSWLMSSLTISPDEQIHFLHRFMTHTLPVSQKAYEMTYATIPQYTAIGGWNVHGKSGSGWLRDKNGKADENKPQGWFIGWAEKEGRKVIFARLEILSTKSNIPGGTKAREEILEELSGLVDKKYAVLTY